MVGSEQVWDAAASAREQPPRLLARDKGRRWLGGIAGSLIARPWLDAATFFGLKRVFFPLSRLWAAAGVADGSIEAFWAASGMPRRHELQDTVARILPQFDAANVAAIFTDAAWDRVFFGDTETNGSTRVAAETVRHNHRHALNETRRLFWPLLNRQTPRVRLDIATPEAADAIYNPTGDTDALFAAPARMPIIEVSKTVAGVGGTDSWLRFKSPSARLGDACYARVHTPEGIDDPPTIILGHGICVEFDHWHGLIDETQALLDLGIRVIRPEAPWHGRRAPPGYFGGERAIGCVPLGMIDLMTGAIQEWAVLADWARKTSRGPLAIGGTSLGALTAQLAAAIAHTWPERLRPDALYLMTHSGDMANAMTSGAVASLFADPRLVAAKGWTPERARRTMSIIDPVAPPVMPASRIVSVLGSRDIITPYAGGDALVRRWNVPAGNLFVSNRGHFTIPMSLVRDPAPTRRFAEILNSLG